MIANLARENFASASRPDTRKISKRGLHAPIVISNVTFGRDESLERPLLAVSGLARRAALGQYQPVVAAR